ncbi:MAG: ABC transporter permease [Lachnospiraceae bacterium]|jgi:ABC-type dipeptide/oligopeptide/nickel transport system permease component|nr:ABC transporter permease [Lachnospiraceae bacterium]
MKYALKKTATMIITLFFVSVLVFFSFSLIPGNPAISKLGTEATPERIEALSHEMGLDKPVTQRFTEWIFGVIRGDFGKSYSYSQSVTSLLSDKIKTTLLLSFMAIIICTVISIPLGIFMARKSDSKLDIALSTINQIIMAVPSFFSGIILTLIFGVAFKLFTPGAYVSYKTNLLGCLGYLFFPALAIALPKISMVSKLLKDTVLKESEKEYVRTAYSRGNRTKAVFYGHVLGNALIPVITFMGMTFADIIAGSIIVEQVFSVPGLGRILLSSISGRDYPVIEAIILLLAFFVVLSNLIVDLLYHKFDPRIHV